MKIFQANQRVKQGCILSPLLFNIFLSDLNTENCKPLEFGDTGKLSCLLWADDLVLVTRTEEGLENMFSQLSSFVEENKMEINIKQLNV